jgi:hypothetical protein
MASTDSSNDPLSRQQTKPMSGFESLPLGHAPMAETAPPGLKVPGAATPVATPPPYGDTVAPTQPRADGPAPPPVGSVFEVCGYKCTRMLGRGGFGKVYLGEAPGGVPCAVKIVEARRGDNEAADRELSALEVIKTLRHPYLLYTSAFFSLEDQLVIVMELADGSLRDELDKSRKAGKKGLPPAELARHMVEAAEAIDYLHDKKMTHRDIKPENILMLSGHAKVADFGLVRVVQENRDQASVSLTGTLAYMAPEVFRGHTHKNSDQYALALTYLELRFGERFVTSTDLVEAMLRHVEHEPDLSRLEPHERPVIQRALAKDPEQRFNSCTEMARALADGFGRTEIRGDSARPVWEPKSEKRVVKPKGKAQEQPKGKRTGILIGVIAAVAVLGIGGLLYGIFGRGKPVVVPISTGKDVVPNPDWPADVFQPVIAQPWRPVRVDGAEIVTDEGKKYFSEIDLVIDETTRIRFVFVPQRLGAADREGNQVAAFYMMRYKVSYEQFARFAGTGVKLQNSQWEKGALKGDEKKKEPKWPVMAVTAEDAQLFCEWLSGDLPSLAQWKKAAGYYNRGGKSGPVDRAVKWEKDEVGCDRAELGPLAVDKSTKDVSPNGIRDTAGNGKEWTHNIHNSPSKRVPLKPPIGQLDLVVQVGKSFAAPEPLLYTELDDDQLDKIRYGDPDDYCGFRVVLKAQ